MCLKPLPLVLLQQTLRKCLSTSLSISSFKYSKTAMWFPQSLLFCKMNNPNSLRLFSEIFRPSNHLHGSPPDSLKQVLIIPVLRTSELDSVFQVQFPRNEREESPPQTCWPPLLLMQPRIWLTFWTANAHC